VDEVVVLDEDEEEEGEQHAGKRKRPQNTLTRFMPSEKLQDEVQRALLCAIITGNGTFKFVNHKHLRRAFGLVGVDLKVGQTICAHLSHSAVAQL